MLLDYLETNVVDNCNLNCKGCSHFSSLLINEQLVDIEVFRRDMIRLRELFDNIITFRLMGGEPLLHPRIIEFYEVARENFPLSNISLVTNGILLSKQSPEFWGACRIFNIKINISQYDVKLPIDQIEQLAKEYSIELIISPLRKRFMKFFNESGDSNARASFRNCQIIFKCPFLREGKLSPCSLALLIQIFNDHFDNPIPSKKDNYIDIHDDVTGTDIVNFLHKPIPLCQWCLTRRPSCEWGISNKIEDEWVGSNTGRIENLRLLCRYWMHRKIKDYRNSKVTKDFNRS